MVTLSDGREVNYDWTKTTQREYLKLFDKTLDRNEVAHNLMAKVTGMSVDELLDLNPIDFKHIEVGMVDSYKERTNFSNVKN